MAAPLGCRGRKRDVLAREALEVAGAAERSVSAATSSSEMGASLSSAWSMRTRTHGFFFEPTTSTSTMSTPCSGAAASSASRMSWRVSCSGTAGMSPPSQITGTYRKEAGRETPPHFLRITTALQAEYRVLSAGGQGARRTAPQGRHAWAAAATSATGAPEGTFPQPRRTGPSFRRRFLAGGLTSFVIPSGSLLPARFRRRKPLFSENLAITAAPAPFSRRRARSRSRGARSPPSGAVFSPEGAFPQLRRTGSSFRRHPAAGGASSSPSARSRGGGESRNRGRSPSQGPRGWAPA